MIREISIVNTYKNTHTNAILTKIIVILEKNQKYHVKNVKNITEKIA